MKETVSAGFGLDFGCFTESERQLLEQTPNALIRKIGRGFYFQNVLVATILLVSLAVLGLVGPGVCVAHPIFVCIAVLIAIAQNTWGIFPILAMRACPIESDDALELLGEWNASELLGLMDSVGQRFHSKRVPRLYIVEEPVGIALVVNDILGFLFPRLNGVYIGQNLFKLLKKEQLAAVMVHELAHYYHYTAPVKRHNWIVIPATVAVFVGCVAFLDFLLLSSDVIFYYVMLHVLFFWAALAHVFFSRLFAWLYKSLAQKLEIISDATAADLIGPLAAVNALLRIHDRCEAIQMVENELYRRLRSNIHIDSGLMYQALIDAIPGGPLERKELRRRLKAVGAAGEKSERCREDNTRLLKELKHGRRLQKSLHVLRWRKFYLLVRDGLLDAQELELYVHQLLRTPLAATHLMATEHPEIEIDAVHPTLRKRILYIYLHFVRNAGKPAGACVCIKTNNQDTAA